MKKIIYYLFFILCCYSCNSNSNKISNEIEIDGILYKIDLKTKTASVIKNETCKYSGKINIPSSIIYSDTTYIVNSISAFAFQNCLELNSITIPETIQKIGGLAFNNCQSLTEIIIPKNIKQIESATFSGCKNLENIHFPDSIIDIGTLAFSNTKWEKKMENTNEIIYIGKCLYKYNEKKHIENIKIPEGTTQIYYCAFQNDSHITNIILPSTLIKINSFAFYNCTSIKNIFIPKNVKEIGDRAFYGCIFLEDINVDTQNTNYSSFDGILYNKEYTSLLCCPSGKTQISIRKDVSTIEDYAFSYCSFLTSINIPQGILKIGNYAFEKCVSLKNLSLEGINPPKITNSTFNDLNISFITLIIQKKSIEKIKNSQWNIFKNIQEI